LRAGARRFTGHSEAVAQHQDAEGQKLCWGKDELTLDVLRFHVGAFGSDAAPCGEIGFGANLSLDVRRRYARRGEALGLDFLFGLFVGHGLVLRWVEWVAVAGADLRLVQSASFFLTDPRRVSAVARLEMCWRRKLY